MRACIERFASLVAVAFGCALGLGASCDHHVSPPPAPAPTVAEHPPPPSVRVYFLADLDGYLEPCGCQSRPLGGIDRIAHVLSESRADAPRSVFVSVGSMFFAEPHLDPRMAYQEQAKARALDGILGAMHLAAYAPGPADFADGATTWQSLSQGVPARALAGNAGMPGYTVIDADSVRVAVIGVSDFAPTDGTPAAGAPVTTDPIASVQSSLAAVRASGAAVTVVLASVSRRTARTIAETVQGVDFVIAARPDEGPQPAPERVGTAYLLTAASQGRGLGVLDVYLHGTGAFVDASEASREAESTRMDARIADLQHRLDGWSHDPTVDPAAVALQRRRLDELTHQRAAIATGEPTTGRYFRESMLDVAQDVERSPDVTRVIGTYFQEVNEHNRVAYASLAPVAAPPGTARYIGAVACAPCHAQAYVLWQTTQHAHAYQTLSNLSKNYNLSCVGCHVTGYREPGGSEVVQNQGLRDVQCEACHGPGSLHVAAHTPSEFRATIRREVPGNYCATHCHTHEHSDRFDDAVYRPRILGPGHGMPRGDAGSSPPGLARLPP